MADIIVDGKVKVLLVDSISDIDAPTVAELNAGTDITDQLTADGLVGFEPESAKVDTTSLASTANTYKPGRDDYGDLALRFKKQVADTVYDTYVKNTETHVCIRRDGTAQSEAVAASEEWEVYPVTTGQTKNLPPEPNTTQRWELPVMLHADPSLRATVAAS